MVKYWQVVTECPIHKQPVFLIVEADTQEDAINNALDMVVHCPWGPINGSSHNFVVGFRGGREEIIGVSPYPWSPPTVRIGKEVFGPISAVGKEFPALTPLKPLFTRETIYYVDIGEAERRIGKTDWW
jgi:hypothetical protein